MKWLNKFWSIMSRQYMLPHYIGGAQTTIANSMFYYSMMQFLATNIILYTVTLSPWAIVHLPWFKMWVFLLILIVTGFAVPILYYKFMLPSQLGFSSTQGYQHDNPVAYDLQHIKKEQAEQKKDLKAIKDKLGVEE